LFLINHLNLLYLPGVLYYLVYLLSYSLIIQNLGIYMYMGQSIVIKLKPTLWVAWIDRSS